MQALPIETLGPGIWFTIHLDAKNAVTDELKDQFITRMENLANNFPCDKCKPHFILFLQQYPLNLFRNITGDSDSRIAGSSDTGVAFSDIGFFKWSYIFHNMVNKRLNKPQLTFEEVYNYYYVTGNNCHSCYAPELTNSSVPVPVGNNSLLKPVLPKSKNIVGRF
jgi:hypothetical protein